MYTGWYQIGFLHEFENDINPVNTANRRMILVKQNGNVKLFDAVCPHRGAHLGYGGRLCDNEIVCPFHGCKIGLYEVSEEGYQLINLPLLVAGNLLYTTQQEDLSDKTFEIYLNELNETHIIIPGFTLMVNTAAEMVIENAFDQMHFRTVHQILNEPYFEVVPIEKESVFKVKSVFELPPSPWQQNSISPEAGECIAVPYEATAFSPFTVISRLGGNNPYYVITSAYQQDSSRSVLHLSIAIPNESFDENNLGLYKYLIEQSHNGLLKDCEIWENMMPGAISRFQKKELSVIGFKKFCKYFETISA